MRLIRQTQRDRACSFPTISQRPDFPRAGAGDPGAGRRTGGAGIAFPVNFDQSCLAFDFADDDGDGVPDGVQFTPSRASVAP